MVAILLEAQWVQSTNKPVHSYELGHNLNLAHGGPAALAIGSSNYNMNCKPNYLSVMSYSRQMPNAVLDAASWEAGFNYAGTGILTALDYCTKHSLQMVYLKELLQRL